MKPTVYIETSVVSYLTSRPSRDTIIAGHQVATQEFWALLNEKLEPYISDLVIQEAEKGNKNEARLRIMAINNFAILDSDDEVKSLAKHILDRKAVPSNHPEDAVHIAVAAVNGIDLIVTWNFKHINNPQMKFAIREAVEQTGYRMPEICSPDELRGGIS